MTRLVVLLGALWLMATQSLPACADPPVPIREGYAFDQPRLLVQQRLFGIAHGVTLLAAACIRQPEYRDVLIPAYEQWRKVQAATIEQSRLDLATHYFGERASETDWADIARALKLKPVLRFKPKSKEMQTACDSFVEVLLKPEYDLHQLDSMAIRLEAARKIEAGVVRCRAMQPGAPFPALDEAIVVWHKSHDAGIAEALRLLGQRWPDPQFARTLAAWLNPAAQRKQQATTEDGIEDAPTCETMSAWLLTKQANPDDGPKPNP